MILSAFLSFVFLCLCVGHGSCGGIYFIIATSKCEQPRGDECIEIRRCPFFNDLLDKTPIPRPRWVIDIIRKYECAIFRNTPFVCCNKTVVEPEPKPEPKPELNPEPKPEPESKESNDPLPTYEKLTNEFTRHKNYALLRNDICGLVPMDYRITSGSKTALEEFPWMALIAYDTENGIDFRCGGTVINERYILTAAHCILDSTIKGVRLGEHNLDTIQDCDSKNNYCAPPTQDFYIEDIKVHPEYDSRTFINDIALIRLATPANFSFSNVKPICLPFNNMNLTGKFAIVSGWGVTETGFKSPELMKASIPVLPISDCQSKYKYFGSITSNQICAGGYKGKDSCAGDSGGPMKHEELVDGTLRFVQHGIVSYGPRFCGAKGQPGIYTKVFEYMKWILDNLEPDEDDSVNFMD